MREELSFVARGGHASKAGVSRAIADRFPEEGAPE
jgi:hypothetical protein